MAPESRRIAGLIIGYGLAIAALLAVGWYLGVNGKALLRAFASITYLQLIVATACFALHIVLNGFGFALAASALDRSLPLQGLMTAWMATLVAKYVPGGIWHVVGRGMALSRLGVDVRQSVAVGIFEQAWSLLLCSAIVLSLHGWIDGEQWLLAIGLGSPFLGLWVMQRVADVFGNVRPVPIRAVLAAASYAAAMLPYALAYLALTAPVDAARFIEALFAGTVAGVLAVLVPGGIGVRESVTVYLNDSGGTVRIMAGLLAARGLLLLLEMFASAAGQWLQVSRRSPA